MLAGRLRAQPTGSGASAAGRAPRILAPSIVNPELPTNGASTLSRGLFGVLRKPPLGAHIECVPAPPTPAAWHRFRQAASLARSLVSTLPSKAAYLYSRRYCARLRELTRRQRFDLVLLNGGDLLWLSEQLPPSIPTVLVAHNMEHLLFASQIRGATWAPAHLRRLLERDCRRLEEYELAGIRRVRNVIFLSREDAGYASRRCGEINTLIAGPLFDYPSRPRQAPKRSPHLHVGFVGNCGWWPNAEGIRWFQESVLSFAGDHVRLHLFGERSQQAAGHPRVTAHGFVADLASVWNQCHFMVCPLSSGGGVSIKVAEALHNRVPILATPFAVRSLELQPDPAVKLLDPSAQWARFLRSDEAWWLAERVPLEANAERFQAMNRLEEIQSFFQRAMAETR